jgi:hypothetical protein
MSKLPASPGLSSTGRASCSRVNTQIADATSGCFVREFDLRLYQKNLISFRVVKIEPLYA